MTICSNEIFLGPEYAENVALLSEEVTGRLNGDAAILEIRSASSKFKMLLKFLTG